LTSDFNKDFNKYKVDDNEYPNAQRILESKVDLILVNPNEETYFYSLLVNNVVNNVQTVKTLKEALEYKSNYAIIVEHNAKFCETLFIEMLIKHNREQKNISTGNIHLLKQRDPLIVRGGQGNTLEDCITDKTLEEFSTLDRPVCNDLTTLKIDESISPWRSNIFAFNTEIYINPFEKINNKEFGHYMMVASGWLWAWLLHTNNWNPRENQYVTLFDVSGLQLLFVENLISYWSPWDQSYTDFVMSNDLAKSIMIKSGWIEDFSEERIKESKEHLDSLWDQEMKRWGDEQSFLEFFRELQWASANGKLSYANLNIISDGYITKKLASSTNGRTFWFVSNIFTSHASRMWSNGSKENELDWYEVFKKRLNKKDIIYGRYPIFDEKEDIIRPEKSPEEI